MENRSVVVNENIKIWVACRDAELYSETINRVMNIVHSVTKDSSLYSLLHGDVFSIHVKHHQDTDETLLTANFSMDWHEGKS